jgi:lipoyl(octanoyl) transferase
VLDVSWLGRLSFAEAESLQWRHRERMLAGQAREALWFAEHDPVFVTGLRDPPKRDLPTRAESSLNGIPVIRSRRGGLVTFHGPGQLMVYCMIDLRQRGISIPDFVCALEEGMMAWLSKVGLEGQRRSGAPGVYIGGKKLCSVGLHFRRWVSIYGLALNLDPDLAFFQDIRPCGQSGQSVTSVSRVSGVRMKPEQVWSEVAFFLTSAIVSNPVDRFCDRGYPLIPSGT